MWEDAPPASDDPLRQGDLLADVPFPICPYPVPSAAPEGSQLFAMLKVKSGHGLVTSHCCDIEGGDSITIAKVHPYNNVTPGELAALRNYEPAEGELAGYSITSFLLDPIGGVFEPKGSALWIASLTQEVTFSGKRSGELKELRIARMTPEGRRHLRLNLGIKASRAEDSDIDALRELGLPAGLMPGLSTPE